MENIYLNTSTFCTRDLSPLVARYYLLKCRLCIVDSREVLPISSRALHRRPRRLRARARIASERMIPVKSGISLCAPRCQIVVRRRRMQSDDLLFLISELSNGPFAGSCVGRQTAIIRPRCRTSTPWYTVNIGS